MPMHYFWLILTIIVLVWYAIICLYVGVKGGRDIRRMLMSLDKKRQDQENKSEPNN